MPDDTLARSVTRLLAIEAIKVLKARYFRLGDMQEWDSWKDLFTRDLTIDVPGFDGVSSRESFVERVASNHANGFLPAIHHGHMPEIEIVDDSTATGIWTLFDYLDRDQKGGRMVLFGYGHYEERYKKIDGEWRISSLKLTRVRTDWSAYESTSVGSHEREEVVRLVRDSFAAIDRGDAQAVRNYFADSARIIDDGGSVIPPSEYAATAMEPDQEAVRTFHFVQPDDAALEADDWAVTSSVLRVGWFTTVDRDGPALMDAMVVHDLISKQAEGWRIRKRSTRSLAKAPTPNES